MFRMQGEPTWAGPHLAGLGRRAALRLSEDADGAASGRARSIGRGGPGITQRSSVPAAARDSMLNHSLGRARARYRRLAGAVPQPIARWTHHLQHVCTGEGGEKGAAAYKRFAQRLQHRMPRTMGSLLQAANSPFLGSADVSGAAVVAKEYEANRHQGETPAAEQPPRAGARLNGT